MSSGTPADRFERFECRVEKDAAGRRLDQFLPEAMDRIHGVELSRRAVRRALQAGSVYLNGKRIRVASRPLNAGAVVAVVLERGKDGAPAAATSTPPPTLDEGRILFEDRDLIVIDKPAGLPTQATRTDALGHALEMVRRHLLSTTGQEPYLALHQRLDRGTSGALVLIKARRANAGMAAAFRHGRVEKVYRVIAADDGSAVWPGDDGGTPLVVDRPLAEDGRRMQVSSLGRAAVTELRKVESLPHGGPGVGGLYLLEARPKTGRKHQIRAHLAFVGLPIVGDRLYGEHPISQLAPRPMLHAYSLAFEHPVTHQPVHVECPEPSDFRLFLGDEAPSVSG